MKKVYLVTQGEYDDYKILGCFSSLEKAKNYTNILIDKKFDIEERIIDPIDGHTGLKTYQVRACTDGYSYATRWDGTQLYCSNSHYPDGISCIDIVVWARSKLHASKQAKKILSEKKEELIVEGTKLGFYK